MRQQRWLVVSVQSADDMTVCRNSLLDHNSPSAHVLRTTLKELHASTKVEISGPYLKFFPTETQINTANNRHIYFFNKNFNIILPSTLKSANICISFFHSCTVHIAGIESFNYPTDGQIDC